MAQKSYFPSRRKIVPQKGYFPSDSDGHINLKSAIFRLRQTEMNGLKSKMAEFRHLENTHDVIFFCGGWFDKISQTDAERHVDCGDMVEIETRCKNAP